MQLSKQLRDIYSSYIHYITTWTIIDTVTVIMIYIAIYGNPAKHWLLAIIILIRICIIELKLEWPLSYNFQVGFGSDYFEPINGYDMRTLNGMIFKGIDAQIHLPGYYKVRGKTTLNLLMQ